MYNKNITSLPSTRHQDMNIASIQTFNNKNIYNTKNTNASSINTNINLSLNPVTQIITDPKTQLIKIIKQMKNFINFRVYLLYRDIQQIYNNSSNFIQQFLHFQNPKQLWKALDKDNDQVLLQRQQITFLAKFITQLTNRKQRYADLKKYIEFTETKALCQWLEERTVEYQKLLRNKVKEKMMRKANRVKKQNQRNMEAKQKQITLQMENHRKNAYLSLSSRQNLQKSNLEEDLIQKVKNSMHKIRPSLSLSKSKDTALLAKLAPFRHQKKRQYQCKQLDKSLAKIMQKDLQRQQKHISHMKNIQRRRLHDKQSLQQNAFEIKLRQRQEQTIIDMKYKRQEIQNSDKIKIHKTIQQANRQSNQRINWIKNSLRAYSQRQQQKKIRQIMRDHHNKTQFMTNIQDVYELNQNNYNPQYSTLNMQCTQFMKDKKKKRYSGFQYQNKLMRKIKREHNLLEQSDAQNQEEIQNSKIQTRRSLNFGSNLSGRKSLVDLYDDDLQLIK